MKTREWNFMFYFLFELWIFSLGMWKSALMLKHLHCMCECYIWIYSTKAPRNSLNVAFSLIFIVISHFMMYPDHFTSPHTPPAQFISHLLLIFFIFSLKISLFFSGKRFCLFLEMNGRKFSGWVRLDAVTKRKFHCYCSQYHAELSKLRQKTRKNEKLNEFSRG